MKMEVLERELLYYNTLSDDRKATVNSKLDEFWDETCKEYAKVCKNDYEYLEAFNKINEVYYVLNYSETSNYFDNVYTGDLKDGDLEFKQSIYDEDARIAKDLKVLNEKDEKKLNKLKKRWIVINRNNKIKMLEEKMDVNKKRADRYNKCQAMIQKRDEYRAHKEKYLDPVEARYNAVLLKNAKSVIKSQIQKHPTLICKAQVQTFNESLTGKQDEVLTVAANQIREQVFEKIRARKKQEARQDAKHEEKKSAAKSVVESIKKAIKL